MTGEVLGIDVGGSSVKAGLVDLKAGRLTGELVSAPTPRPSTPVALAGVLAGLAARLPAGAGRVGVAFPSVIKDGTAYNRRQHRRCLAGHQRRGARIAGAGAAGAVPE